MNNGADMLDGLPLVYRCKDGGYSWNDGEVEHWGTLSQIWDYLQCLGFDDYVVRDWLPSDVAD